MIENNKDDNVEKNHTSVLKITEEQKRMLAKAENWNPFRIDNSFSVTETKSQGIGGNIAFYRTSNGISQEKLAELMRVDRTTISNWERDKGCPDGYQLEDLARIFKVDTAELHTKKVYILDKKGSSHPQEEKLEKDWLEKHPDDFLNQNYKEGKVSFWEGNLIRDYVRIDRVDLLVVALELIERGFCVIDCFFGYTDGDPFNCVSVVLKKEEISKFKNAISEILICFANGTSRFQSVIELRYSIYKNHGGCTVGDVEKYIKGNKVLSNYHYVYECHRVDGTGVKCDQIITHGTQIEKTWYLLKKMKPNCFMIKSVDDMEYDFEYSNLYEDFDWDKIEGK